MAIKIVSSTGVSFIGTQGPAVEPPPQPSAAPTPTPTVEPDATATAAQQAPEPKPTALSLADALAQNAGPVIETKITPTVELHPWDIDETYTILEALKDFAENKRPKQVLKLVHKHTAACSYTVKAYDPDTGRAQLEGGFKGGLLKPVITEREVPIYYPVWL